VRGIIERTRADLTLSLREQRLQESMQRFAERLPRPDNDPHAND